MDRLDAMTVLLAAVDCGSLVLEEFESAPQPVHLVYDRQNRLPLKLRAFIDFAIPRLRKSLTEAVL